MAKTRKFRRTFIREWRKQRDLTLEQLGSRMNMTPSHLSMLERGQRGYTQVTLESLSDALRVDVATLIMSNPLEPDTMWSIWSDAKPGQKRQITESAQKLLKVC